MPDAPRTCPKCGTDIHAGKVGEHEPDRPQAECGACGADLDARESANTLPPSNPRDNWFWRAAFPIDVMLWLALGALLFSVAWSNHCASC